MLCCRLTLLSRQCSVLQVYSQSFFAFICCLCIFAVLNEYKLPWWCSAYTLLFYNFTIRLPFAVLVRYLRRNIFIILRVACHLLNEEDRNKVKINKRLYSKASQNHCTKYIKVYLGTWEKTGVALNELWERKKQWKKFADSCCTFTFAAVCQSLLKLSAEQLQTHGNLALELKTEIHLTYLHMLASCPPNHTHSH